MKTLFLFLLSAIVLLILLPVAVVITGAICLLLSPFMLVLETAKLFNKPSKYAEL